MTFAIFDSLLVMRSQPIGLRANRLVIDATDAPFEGVLVSFPRELEAEIGRLQGRHFTEITRMKVASGALLTASLLSFAAVAHHGWSGYDAQRTMTLTGTIQSASYENPHGTMVLKSDQGTWNVVLAPPGRMTARGLNKEMLRDGASASVEGYPHTEKKDELRAERITIDGKTIELR